MVAGHANARAGVHTHMHMHMHVKWAWACDMSTCATESGLCSRLADAKEPLLAPMLLAQMLLTQMLQFKAALLDVVRHGCFWNADGMLLVVAQLLVDPLAVR